MEQTILNPYVEALITQLVRDNEALDKTKFSLSIPVDYQERVFNERGLVKSYLETLGYTVQETGLPADWSNGWELNYNRSLDVQPVPEDMSSANKNRSLYKRGAETYLNYRIWVSK